VNILDIIIIVAALAYGIGGFRSGAVVGIFSLIGFFGGAVVGAQLAKPIGSHVASGRAQIPVAIVCVLVLATLGQLLGVFLAGRLKARFIRGGLRPWDSALGAVMGVVGVLLVAWMVAVPLASSPFPTLAAQASHSRIVRAVNNVLPNSVRTLYSSLRSFLDRSGFPPVFGDLQSTRIVDVPAPDAGLADDAAVAQARQSTFKIRADAPNCDRATEGSGFVYAPGHILTNAHVVAGSSAVRVETPGGSLSARVVVYDPEVDVAVLSVNGLSAPALSFAQQPAATGDDAIVLGYPEDGPFNVQPARIRERGEITGRDIYGDNTIRREIYSIRGTVRSGNSGGPLISGTGTVLGMVFATALDSTDTGFVLTDAQISGDANAGLSATAAVSTQTCD
jgi:S1-C subfamily serine protease